MSWSTFWADVENDINNLIAWVKGIFSRLVSDTNALIPVVIDILQTAENFLNSPEAVTIEGLIPSGVGTTIAATLDEWLADIIAELSTIKPTLIVISASASGAPVYSNPDAIAKTAFQAVSQLSVDGQAHFFSGYATMILQKLAPAGSNLSYADSQLALAVAKWVKAHPVVSPDAPTSTSAA